MAEIDDIDADLLDAIATNAKAGLDSYSVPGRSVTATGLDKQLAALRELRALQAGGVDFARSQNVAEVIA